MNTNPWVKVEMGVAWNSTNEDGSFRLEEGDELVGVYTGKEEHVGANDANIYSFKTENGPMSVWGSTVLDTRLKNLVLGEEVKIIYRGKVESQKRKGASYYAYEVFHREVVKDDIPVIEE